MSQSDDDMEVLSTLQAAIDSRGACEAAEAEVCELCGKEIQPGNRSKHRVWGMSLLDKPCFNSLHSVFRMLADRPKLRAQLEVMRRESPAKFAGVMLRLRTDRKNSRSRGSLQNTLGCLEILASERTKARTEKQLLFTKTQYIAWKK